MSITAAFTLKDNSLIKTQAFVEGKWVDADDGKVFKVINPSTGEALGTAPDLGRAETANAINAAEKAFGTWSKTTAKYRHDILLNMAQLIYANTEDLGRIIALEHGKTLSDGKVTFPALTSKELLIFLSAGRGQLLGFIHSGDHFLTYYTCVSDFLYSGSLRKGSEHTEVSDQLAVMRSMFIEVIQTTTADIRNVVIKQPVGVVGAVTPSNFPAAMVTRKLGPALAAGCTVVLKPSSSTPYSALAIAELARRAGVPDGVINVVTTKEHVGEVGRELCENKTVEKITFTGSSRVAKLFYRQSVETMKKVTLAGSGNAPFIVFNDADLDDALIGTYIFWKGFHFVTLHQGCNGASRVYIQSSVYDDFVARLVGRVSKFKIGGGLEEGTTHGPLIHSRAVDKIEAVVNDAVKRGASVLAGGKRLNRPGSFFEPTILTDVPKDALYFTEENSSPVIALIKFETEEEVLRLANDSNYGLAGYFYSLDVRRVWRVIEALQVGLVGANSHHTAGTHIPFNGIKESGLGFEGGHSIESFLNIKHISFGGI
ncbi:succinate-semialdehyde dehydrogenase [Ramaria rubella]|nr:succinate-semialdehyde dehydrogenase [Ramaria rubella]